MADAADTTMTTDTTTSTSTEGVGATDTVVTETPTTEATSTETPADETTLLGGENAKASEDGDGDKGEAGEVVGAPETYEIALNDAEGNAIPLDADMLAAATEVFREFNLTNEQANKLVPLGHQMMLKGMEAAETQMLEAVANSSKAWLDEFKADPEIGGNKADETLTLAAKALDSLGYPAGSPFRELLNISGLGNHPEMIRVFRKVGEAVSEDTSFASPDAAGEKKVAGWADLYDKSDD